MSNQREQDERTHGNGCHRRYLCRALAVSVFTCRLSQGWELLGTIGFVAFCSFMPQAAVNRGLSKARRLIIQDGVGVFRRAGCRLAGPGEWTVRVLGERNYDCTLLGGGGLARAFLVTVFYSRGFLGMTLFCQQDELDGDITGFSGG